MSVNEVVVDEVVNPNELTTSTRKRPNKAKILKQGRLRGHLTDNENLMLSGLKVKNVLQRVNNRSFDDLIKPHDCKKLQSIFEEFVTNVDSILKEKYQIK
jgi:hypothetical protein